MARVAAALLLVSIAAATEVVTPTEHLMRDGSVVIGTDDGMSIERTADGGEAFGHFDPAQVADVTMTHDHVGIMEQGTLVSAVDVDHVVIDLPRRPGIAVRLGWMTVPADCRRAVDDQLRDWAARATTVWVWTPGAAGAEIAADAHGKVTAIVLGDRWQTTAWQVRLVDAKLAKPNADLTALPARFATMLAVKR